MTHHGSVLKNAGGSILEVPIQDFTSPVSDEYELLDCEILHHSSHLVSLRRDGGLISATGGGATKLSLEINAWEKFFEIDLDDLLYLKEGLKALFVLKRPDDVTGDPLPIKFDGSENFRIGRHRYPFFDNIPVLVESVRLKSSAIILFSYGWKVDIFQVFNPLIYYCVFGPDAQLELLRNSVSSCIQFGRYGGSFCIITDRPDEARMALGELDNRVITLEDSADNLHDYWRSRYGVFRYSVFEQFSPIMYVDTDVAVDRDMTSTLVDIQSEKGVSVYSEPRLAEERDSHGRFIMERDGLNPSYFMAVNSGIFGFASLYEGQVFLRGVYETMARYKALVGNCETFNYFDQSVANYVLRKSGLASFKAFRGKVRTYWGGIFEDGEYPLGFCHFTTRPKLPDFSSYVEIIQKYYDETNKITPKLAKIRSSS